MKKRKSGILPPDAFLRTTRQLWKLHAAGIIALGGVAYALSRTRAAMSGSTPEFLALAGILIGALAMTALLLRSIACPRCGNRLLGAVFTDPDSAAALDSFLSRRDCGACGYEPAGDAATNSRSSAES